MDLKQAARDAIEAARDELLDLSRRIHANPELRYEEHQSSAWLAEYLAGKGMAVEKPYCALSTAFKATAGPGPLHIAICAEYDALPDVGHACGHNIIATAAAGAGVGLAKVADEAGLTVSVIGTPAEEGGGGKILLLGAGGFDGVHAAMMVHPAPMDMLLPSILAAQRVEVRYTGKAAHASSAPQLGINAADAMTVAQVAIGLLRQSMRSTDRVHGIVTRGGEAPNIIPQETSASYSVRSRTLAELEQFRPRVLACFEAGAVATGAKLQVIGTEFAYSEMRHDGDIAAFYQANAQALGRVFPPVTPRLAESAGSTDMGNVSLQFPSIHPMIGIDSLPAVNHQPEFAAHCITPAADRAVTDGAIAMAWTAIDCAAPGPVRDRLLAAPRAG
jgi:amidohydrolase